MLDLVLLGAAETLGEVLYRTAVSTHNIGLSFANLEPAELGIVHGVPRCPGSCILREDGILEVLDHIVHLAVPLLLVVDIVPILLDI